MVLPIVVPGHLFGDVVPERRRVREVEVELEQIAQPHRLVPEGLHAVAVDVLGVCQRQFDDGGLQKGMDHRVAVERRGVLVFGRDLPHRLPAAVDPSDGVPVGQRVHRRPHTVRRAQPQGTGRHRILFAFQVIQRVLQGVMQLAQGQRRAAGGQQQRAHQPGRRHRRRLQDPPGDFEGHLLQRKAFGVGVLRQRAVRRTQVLAHRHGLGESDVDLAVVAFALRPDEVVQPAHAFGRLLTTAGVGGVLRGLVQLIEADRNRLQQNVFAAAIQVGVGNVGQQAEFGRQHLAGARAGALDGPAQVEPLLDDVADVFSQDVLVELVVADVAADEDDTGAPQQRPHRPERQVDAGEDVHRR